MEWDERVKKYLLLNGAFPSAKRRWIKISILCHLFYCDLMARKGADGKDVNRLSHLDKKAIEENENRLFLEKEAEKQIFTLGMLVRRVAEQKNQMLI